MHARTHSPAVFRNMPLFSPSRPSLSLFLSLTFSLSRSLRSRDFSRLCYLRSSRYRETIALIFESLTTNIIDGTYIIKNPLLFRRRRTNDATSLLPRAANRGNRRCAANIASLICVRSVRVLIAIYPPDRSRFREPRLYSSSPADRRGTPLIAKSDVQARALLFVKVARIASSMTLARFRPEVTHLNE